MTQFKLFYYFDFPQPLGPATIVIKGWTNWNILIRVVSERFGEYFYGRYTFYIQLKYMYTY